MAERYCQQYPPFPEMIYPPRILFSEDWPDPVKLSLSIGHDGSHPVDDEIFFTRDPQVKVRGIRSSGDELHLPRKGSPEGIFPYGGYSLDAWITPRVTPSLRHYHLNLHCDFPQETQTALKKIASLQIRDEVVDQLFSKFASMMPFLSITDGQIIMYLIEHPLLEFRDGIFISDPNRTTIISSSPFEVRYRLGYAGASGSHILRPNSIAVNVGLKSSVKTPLELTDKIVHLIDHPTDEKVLRESINPYYIIELT